MRKRIPEGDYQFQIVRADFRRELDVTFRIVDGMFVGRTISKSFAVRGDATWQLHQLLQACGVRTRPSRMKLHLDTLIGLECAGSIAHDCGESFIYQFFPIAELKQQQMEQWMKFEASDMPRYVM